jgi:ribosomal protein L9
MPIPLIIGAGSGLVSAALFASAATATLLAGVLFYLAPLPLCLAGLGWGGMAALFSALTGTVVIAASLGPTTAAVFALSIAAPTALLAHLALLSRPAATPNGQVVGALEWYPPGRVVGWAALIAGLLAAILVLIIGYDQEAYRDSIRQILEHSTLKEFDRDGTVFTEEAITSLSTVLARALPAAFAVIWLTITLFNLWMAALIVDASGRARRPWPDLHGFELPNALVPIFAGALAASFLPGLPGLLATGLAGALLFAYVLQGLAVIHVYSRGAPFRAVLLAAVYLGILLLDGFARNYLLPLGKALRATEANRKRFERERAQLEARDLELKSEAQAVSAKLDGHSFIIIRQAGEGGQLYGSVSTRDIAVAVTEGGFSVERRQVMLDRPIKSLGLHEIRVTLHPEVVPHIIANVARSADEATRQARGEDVSRALTEAEEDAEAARIAAAALFEDGAPAELAGEAGAEEEATE